MKPDTRPGPQAKYSKHIASNKPPKETDAHCNPLGTVYVLKFPGGRVNCEFVCLGSYQALQREKREARDTEAIQTDKRQREQIEALWKALNGLLPMFDNDNPLLTVYVAEIEQARAALQKVSA